MFSQEDVLVSLMWGSQVLQKLAQQVRVSENKILVAEKLASMAVIYEAMPWPGESFDQAWRALMLAQHHDCWIVPYNKRHGDTWADMVTKWTGTTNRSCDGIIESSVIQLSENSFDSDDKYVRVFNTLGAQRHEPVTLALPETLKMSHCRILDSRGNEVSSQLIHDPVTRERAILFLPDVPSMGYNTYRIQPVEASTKTEASVNKRNDGTYQLETDLYRIILDPARGGILKSLIAKEIGSREFIDRNSERGFNALRGHFYDEGGFLDSSQNLATVDILENGPVRIRVKVNGTIAASPFSQMITLVQGQKRIDFDVTIDWKSNLGIGAYSQSKDYDTKNPKKAFYQDKFKLRALFPLNLESQKVYKNAPFDVCQSRLNDTFFDSWDSIKHNLIVNWVDVTDASDQFGVALFSDHTTSYTHGREEPLGLTLQYSGKGLWGRNYSITGPTNVRYAIIPHRGKWDESGIWTEGAKWNEPLIAQVMNAAPQTSDYKRTLLAIDGQDIEVVSLMFEEHTLYIRLFNAESGASTSRLSFDCIADSVELVELNGDVISRLDVSKNAKAGMAIDLSIPKFGVRTLKLSNVKSVHTDSF
jgi:alpha-mannosidase